MQNAKYRPNELLSATQSCYNELGRRQLRLVAKTSALPSYCLLICALGKKLLVAQDPVTEEIFISVEIRPCYSSSIVYGFVLSVMVPESVCVIIVGHGLKSVTDHC